MYRLLLGAMILSSIGYVFTEIRNWWRRASLQKLDKVMLPDGTRGAVTAIEKWEDGTFYGVLRDDGVLEYYKRDQIIKKVD